MKKTLTLAILLLASTNSFAQFREDIIIQREIAPQYAKVVVAEAYMRSENANLSKVSSSMTNKLLSSIKPQFIKGINVDKDEDMNTLYLSGEVKGEHAIKYQFSRNLINSYAAYSVIKGKLENNNTFDSIQDLNGNNLSLSKVKVEKINGENFLIYNDNNEAKTFIEGNIDNQINIQIQTNGSEHELRAKDFLKSVPFNKIKEALSTNSYTTTFAEMEEKIEEKAKDPKYVKRIFSGH